VSLIITANHVIKDGSEFKVDGKSAKLVGHDAVWDLAALTVRTPYVATTIATKKPLIGDRLTVCGYGSGVYKESTGIVTSYFSPGSGSNDIIAINIAARSGDSGGPMFNSEGLLAATLFGSDKLGAHGSCCIQIRRFIKTLELEPRLKAQALREPYILYGREHK
jgi:S1-C subfamily serine protease